MKTRTKIRHFVMMGDSLSDRGTLNKRHLFSIIPMSIITGLSTYSPKGRFTNGYTWDDDFGAMIASIFIAKHLKIKLGLTAADIADGAINNDIKIDPAIQDAYHLDNDKGIDYRNKDFLRSYNEGGMTADDYEKDHSWVLSILLNREIASNLNAKREELLTYDANHHVTPLQKAETLVVEWSGANDLILVNSKPTREIVDRAVRARIENATALIQQGYQHFILIGLPKISLTPRFQAMKPEERKNADECAEYFNQQLNLAIEALKKQHKNISMTTFDTYQMFDYVYQNPEKYGFDAEKLEKPYIKSKDFQIHRDTSPAKGYMFWDDVHPTADMHAIIAENFYAKVSSEFDFQVPPLEITDTPRYMLKIFLNEYRKSLENDKNRLLGSWRYSELLTKLKTVTLEEQRDYFDALLIIVDHGQNTKTRTHQLLIKLGWMDASGKINTEIPALAVVKKKLEQSSPTLSGQHSKHLQTTNHYAKK